MNRLVSQLCGMTSTILLSCWKKEGNQRVVERWGNGRPRVPNWASLCIYLLVFFSLSLLHSRSHINSLFLTHVHFFPLRKSSRRYLQRKRKRPTLFAQEKGESRRVKVLLLLLLALLLLLLLRAPSRRGREFASEVGKERGGGRGGGSGGGSA